MREVATDCSGDHVLDFALDGDFLGAFCPLGDNPYALTRFPGNRCGDDFESALTDHQFAALPGAMWFGLAHEGRVVAQHRDIAAQNAGHRKLRNARPHITLDVDEGFHHRRVGIDDVAVGIGDAHIPVHEIERCPDAQVLCGHCLITFGAFLQVDAHLFERHQQMSYFVTVAGHDGAVENAIGNGTRMNAGIAQASGDAATESHPRDTDHGGDDQHDECNPGGLAQQYCVHVVDIDAGADDPAPGFEGAYVRHLVYRRIGTRTRPHVIDEACAIRLGHRDEFDEQVLAVGVLRSAQILALELRLGRMHDHARSEIVDPEIVFTVVAQRAQRRDGLFAGFLLRQFAGHRPLLERGEDTPSGFDREACCQLAILEHVGAHRTQQQCREQHDPDQAARNHQHQALLNSHAAHDRHILCICHFIHSVHVFIDERHVGGQHQSFDIDDDQHPLVD